MNSSLRIAQPLPVLSEQQPVNTTRIQNTAALATEFVVVSKWAPIAGNPKTAGLSYEDFTDQRKAEDAFADYERGEYPRATAVCIFASRHGVPIGRVR